ncbi:hypothetical protein G7Y89_g7171 [Cudoniella acicularis]|uniref:C2H2-type domain-containing protein n=1 Tax=Cudoniella acicularis TaxID=354080 RepID=A0A8H4RJ21_9HELO|nr:hypothetical protein G7Y89_g7171 [Cudoniella acicularis]
MIVSSAHSLAARCPLPSAKHSTHSAACPHDAAITLLAVLAMPPREKPQSPCSRLDFDVRTLQDPSMEMPTLAAGLLWIGLLIIYTVSQIDAVVTYPGPNGPRYPCRLWQVLALNCLVCFSTTSRVFGLTSLLVCFTAHSPGYCPFIGPVSELPTWDDGHCSTRFHGNYCFQWGGGMMLDLYMNTSASIFLEPYSQPPSTFLSLAFEQDNTGNLAVTAQAPGQAWGRWAEQHTHQPVETFYAMDISGLIQSYDSRATSSAAITRAILAPQYVPAHAYSGAPSSSMIASQHQLQQQQQHNPFSFGSYAAGSSTSLVPAFATNYIQQRPLPRLMQSDSDGGRRLSYSRNTRQGFVEEHHSQSPPIKSEPNWNTPTPTSASSSFASSTTKTISSTAPVNGASEVNFGTEVDTLMKAIQAKSQNPAPQASSTEQTRTVVGASLTPPYTHAGSQSSGYASGEASTFKLTRGDHQDETANAKGSKKRYQCTIENCTKSFYQKTHLDIHERAHTGVKPYPCKEPGCGRSFSQLGNLKTHERRHTGERPYQCETCGKRFAQRGNVRAHKIVHDQAKPYLCRLDDCGKQFTQLGNLKSHQNKFHIATIRSLTAKFASIKDGDIVHAADKELWEYFANLYKNSNKGIKGRGKDRKVGSNSMALTSSMRGLGVGGSGGYSMSGPGRGNMVVGVIGGGLVGTHPAGHGENSQYEIFDVDDESQSGSHSGSGGGSSVDTCYDDAPSDGFEDTSRGGDLAFGDRIY